MYYWIQDSTHSLSRFLKQESRILVESSQIQEKLENATVDKVDKRKETQLLLSKTRISILEDNVNVKQSDCQVLKDQIQRLRDQLNSRHAFLIEHKKLLDKESIKIKSESIETIRIQKEVLDKDVKRLVHAQSWLFKEFNTIFELRRIPNKAKAFDCFTPQPVQYKIRSLNPMHTFEIPSPSQLEEYNASIVYISHMMCILSHYVDRMLPYPIEWKGSEFMIDGILTLKLILETPEPFYQALAMLNYNLVELCLGKGIQIDFELSVDTLGLFFKLFESQSPFSSIPNTQPPLDIHKLIQLQKYLFSTPSDQRSREQFEQIVQQEMELLSKESEWQII